jgi:hypothetical protein
MCAFMDSRTPDFALTTRSTPISHSAATMYTSVWDFIPLASLPDYIYGMRIHLDAFILIE